MRDAHGHAMRLAACVAGLVVATPAGCGDSSQPAGGGGTTSSSTSATAHTTVKTTATGSGGSGGQDDGNYGCDTAVTVAVDDPEGVVGKLEPAATDEDYIAFAGTKGQRIALTAISNPNQTQGYLDIVLDVFDPNGQPLAHDDDPMPRVSQDSQLFMVLPADGTYCVRVMDFCAWLPAYGNGACPPMTVGQGEVDDNYRLLVTTMKPDVEDTEPNDDAATATSMVYPMTSTQTYGAAQVLGTFGSDADVDVYALTPPTNATGAEGTRTTLDTLFVPTGADGNGSTATLGSAWLTTRADPATILARIDGKNIDKNFGMSLAMPISADNTVPAGAEYLLWLKPAAGPVGDNPFYFLRHALGAGALVEKDDVANDTPSGAEIVPGTPHPLGAQFTFEGDLGHAGDVDHFRVSITTGTRMGAGCDAARIGSGLRGLSFKVFGKDGTTLVPGAEASEAPDGSIAASLGNNGLPMPAGETELVIRVEAASQDPVVTSSYYRCGVVLITPP